MPKNKHVKEGVLTMIKAFEERSYNIVTVHQKLI